VQSGKEHRPRSRDGAVCGSRASGRGGGLVAAAGGRVGGGNRQDGCGLRIEDDVVVTPDGCELLTDARRELIEVGS
jgi:hypothetical protein